MGCDVMSDDTMDYGAYGESTRAWHDAAVTTRLVAAGVDPNNAHLRALASQIEDVEQSVQASLRGLKTMLSTDGAENRIDPSYLTGSATLLTQYRTLTALLRKLAQGGSE